MDWGRGHGTASNPRNATRKQHVEAFLLADMIGHFGRRGRSMAAYRVTLCRNRMLSSARTVLHVANLYG